MSKLPVKKRQVAHGVNLLVRIGFWGPLYTLIVLSKPQNSIGNYRPQVEDGPRSGGSG